MNFVEGYLSVKIYSGLPGCIGFTSDTCLHKLFLHGVCLSSVTLLDVVAQTIAQDATELPFWSLPFCYYTYPKKPLDINSCNIGKEQIFCLKCRLNPNHRHDFALYIYNLQYRNPILY